MPGRPHPRGYHAVMSRTSPPSPADLGARLVAAVPDTETSVSGGGAFARATIDVAVGGWTRLVRAARDELGCDFFDWLSAVDELDRGLAIVVHVWSTAGRDGALLRTHVASDAPRVDSVVELYLCAALSERETHEMFGVDFVGYSDLKPLLLPPDL